MGQNYSFKIKALAGHKGNWMLSLENNAFTLSEIDGDNNFLISRHDAEDKTEIRESRFTEPLLSVNVPPKKLVFKLGRAQAALFKKWIGPPTIRGLKAALKRRLKWSLPIGVLFVITSIPLPADPVAELEAVPFDAVSAFLGTSLIMMSILTHIFPKRILFLLDGIWFSLLALDVSFDIFHDSSPWLAILVIFLVISAKTGFAEYQRFSSLSHQ